MSAGTFALRCVRSSDAGSLGACRPVAPREAAPQAGLLASLALHGGAAALLASLAGSPPPGEQGLGATPVVFVGTAVADGAADGGTAETAARADGPEGEDPEGRETAAPESLSDTPPVIEPVPEPPPAAPPPKPVPATALSPVSPVPERNAPSQVAAVAPAGEEMSVERADDRPTEPVHAPTPEAVPARQPARAALPRASRSRRAPHLPRARRGRRRVAPSWCRVRDRRVRQPPAGRPPMASRAPSPHPLARCSWRTRASGAHRCLPPIRAKPSSAASRAWRCSGS